MFQKSAKAYKVIEFEVEIRQFIILISWFAGSFVQVSNVPSITFFHNYLQNSLQKLLKIIVYFLIMKIKSLRALRSSTCRLTGFFWLFSHMTYLKLTRVYYKSAFFPKLQFFKLYPKKDYLVNKKLQP